MKLVGIVGSNAVGSYNRLLLQFIQKHFNKLIDLDIVEIDKVPLFNQSDDQTQSPVIQDIAKRIEASDGVIIATPEHNHTIPAALKSLIEWLSFKIHPFENKPVMIVGASYFSQGSSRAQLSLRQILDSPGVNAIVLPGNEFLLGNVKEAFDEENNLKDQGTINFLASCLEKFIRFIKVVSELEGKGGATEVVKPIEEDLFANGKIDTTIEGVEMTAPDWVEQAAEKVNPATGNDYVKLNRGILTVNQIDQFLRSMPMELTFADSNNQFLYYNSVLPSEEMFAKRYPEQPGNPLGACHPDRTHKNVKWVISQLRSGKQDIVRVHVPTHGPDKFVVHNYQAIRDDEGNYMGINEYIMDIKPTVDWYLQQTGQELVGGKDTVSGASQSDNKQADTVSGASQSNAAEPEVDTVSGASSH
ncbi:NAD(P)H-dependent oxidoreductase [Ruoffia tabacinasalis]|uniref:NAD(P)H-dependent oxidoreductase n=1 Tax=Ruoffia tabacinasalis TaxID=87458 RepID=A0ABS0LGV9_9LACT|nr:NAD(P)H-dependent oxidoreductase [Ruoffia tabacinasalis]MBG9977394.1 NAD(P)H-dependent oxidoreductase [Ruoffia tabacinasalis]